MNKGVYIIHFSSYLSHARHYVGYADDIQARFQVHKSGQGAKILRACNQKGIDYKIVRVIMGDRKMERRIKNTHNVKRYCPICAGDKMCTQRKGK